ncbi:asparagine synthase-related protein [Caulobacter sp. LjRoot300]|uniref:asparagine synthase-related protein n=1 Tax=Caulobacter sp. LjRoot300 TaxID=3342321 RepID=UPI003ECDC64F
MPGFVVEGRFGFLGAHGAFEGAPLSAAGWREARATAQVRLWVRDDTEVRDTARGWIVGPLFERGSARCAPLAPAGLQEPDLSLEAFCAKLFRSFWGQYVLVVPDERAVLRDPSGHLECMTWNTRTGWAAGSEIPQAPLPASAAPAHLAIDWAAVAEFAAGALAAYRNIPLKGVEPVLPGELKVVGAPAKDRMIWDPTAFALNPHDSYKASLKAVSDAVQESVGTELASGALLLAEISGGLDSAIVASTLVAQGGRDRTRLVHFHVDDPGGDERAYARDVARHLEADLLEIVKPELRIDADILAQVPVGVRPSSNAADHHYDMTMADLVHRTGARKILTGQGGDMVFFQSPSRKVAAELWGPWLRRPRADPLWRQLESAARWNRCSVWSLIGEAVRDAIAAPRTALDPHPWLATAVAPAKRRQLESLIRSQVFHGASRRGRHASLIHPLLSQPVMEATLAAPVVDLARGGRGRALAREAFAGQIPASVRERRSKGVLTAYHGRMILRSLAAIRPFLLEGRLAQEHVLDRDFAEAMLDPDRLIYEGDYPRLFETIVLEAYVRHWEGRFASAAGEAEGAASLSASQGSTSP